MISLLVVRLRQKSLQVFLEVQLAKSAHYAGTVSSLDSHRNCLDGVTSCIFIACSFLVSSFLLINLSLINRSFAKIRQVKLTPCLQELIHILFCFSISHTAHVYCCKELHHEEKWHQYIRSQSEALSFYKHSANQLVNQFTFQLCISMCIFSRHLSLKQNN